MSSTSGKLFTAVIGASTTITGLTRGEMQEQADELDSTDSDTAPYYFTDIGCKGMRGTLEGNFRPAGMQYPALKAGTVLTGLKVYQHGTGGSNNYFYFPLAICLPGTTTMEIKGKVTFTVVFASQGIFYQPGDTIPP